MRRKIFKQCLSVLVVISVLLTALPITAIAQTTDVVSTPSATDNNYTSPVEELLEEEIIQDVVNAQELELALADQMKLIRIAADFEIDRTFYIPYDAVIYSDESHTLTRSATFAGDVFVVGQDAVGNAYENVIFSLGGSVDGGENLLTIDGNSQNMTVDVLGSIIFVCSHAQADLYPDLTVTNNKKVGNERALDSAHGLSNTKYIGGAVAILSKDSLMNIYGGIYSNNSVNASGSSVYGGAFYNFATLNVYGGTFENNSAVRAGAFYNYRKLTITDAVIKNNTASSLGGAIYLPSSTGALLYLGTEDDSKNISVSFIGNSAPNAGAIYSAGRIFMNDTLLESNSATESGGAIYGSGNYDVIKINDSEFKSNTAVDTAGAIYITGQTTLSATEELNVKNSAFTENSAKNGGALYLAEGTRVYLTNVNFSKNSTTANGGAITCNASTLEINGAQFTENSAYHGGALVLTEAAVALFNNITADSNTAKNNGGVIHNTGSTLTIYNSNFKNNTASVGSAAYLYTSAVNNIYKTKFIGNSCYDTNTGNAGAVFLYTGGTESLLHSCTFIDNTSSGLGGALLISGKSIANIYNLTAINNTAGKGGALYETSAGTVVSISGMTVSGNTATTGGPIIWGNTANAKLFINKSNYADLDINGDLPSDYWSTAIANKLTVSETDEEIPTYTDYGNESMGTMWDATDVATADELESALNAGDKHIRVTANIEADRTFYVTKTTTIFSTATYKITRANNFDGNIFVVGKTKDGNVCEEKVTLTLGNTNSTTKNLLTFDGNKDNTTVTVIGSALLITGNAQVDLYDNITIFNNQNNGNGAAALIEENAIMNIYGGSIENNQAVNGGAIYNSANLNVLSDALKNNTAQNGGAVYNTGTLTTDGAVFTANNAVNGGAVYTQGGTLELNNATFMQNTATDGGALYVTDNAEAENSNFTVTSCDFAENTAQKSGGAIYSLAENLDINDSSFTKNVSAENGGAVAIVSSSDTILNNITAKNNTAKANGGFLYTDSANIRINSSALTENSAENGGAVALANSSNSKILDTELQENVADWNGGALYVCDQGTTATVLESNFENNISTDGAAISVENAYIELNAVEFIKNTADINGGAICLIDCEDSLLSNITADSNIALGDGGFLYSQDSDFKVYNSNIQNNTAGMDGGALALYQQTACGIYATDFENNKADRNGGAVYLSTKGTAVTMQRCNFTKNSAENNGGVILTENGSILNLYETNATNNSAVKGGIIYAGTNTQTTVNGINVSGNTADSGEFIYGNTYSAVLNINKSNFTDSDITETLDKNYWDTVIAGKIKINETTDGIPIYPESDGDVEIGIPSAFDVKNAQELESAITAGEKYIRITADFEIDRTFYITSDVTIFSTAPHTLTRAADFAGDIFVVGETKDGINSMLQKANAYLALGHPTSEIENLLTIDGNKTNMTVEVTGTVIFICYGAKADLYKNIAIINCHKTGNERTHNEGYSFSRPNRIGGSVAILSQGVLNIYGGIYKNNSCKEEDTSTEEGRNSTNGGLFYNESNLRIYGGTFENNQGARGAIVYNYGIMKIVGGSFINNHSTVISGMYYSPNSASAHLAIGSTEQNDNPVIFKNNTAAQSAGVIYSGIMNGLIIYGNTVFEGNQALNGNGGVICVYGMLTAKNTVFKDNSSTASGGAIYSTYTSAEAKTRYVNISDCTFTNNHATSGGALALNASSSEFVNGAIATVTNSEFISNTAKSGGAISTDIKSQLTVKDSLFTQNSSQSEAGVIYAEYQSVVNIFGSTFTSNTSGSHGGVISLRSSYLNVDQTEFSDNASGANGGILYVSYLSSCDNNSDVVITNSLISGNHADSYGGAMYVTRRNIENDTQILTVKNTDFTQNSAGSNGGAIVFTGNSESYLTDVTFTSNTAYEGGALCMFSSFVDLDNVIFSRNTSRSSGGAVFMDSGSNAVMNNITASRNKSSGSGGFLYGIGCQLKMYDSDIKNNSGTYGGGIYASTSAILNIYNTTFSKNTARTQNGGGLFLYTEGTESIIHSCKFDSNTANNVGGGIYVSGESLAKMYNLTAIKNSAVEGGFMYHTKAGTVVDLSGLTVSGNTAQGGPIIWGNTRNATLNIDKSNYNDLDYTGEYTEDYWSNAIKNLLTVNDTSINVPEYDSYISKDEPEEEVVRKEPVPVTDVLNLGLNSSDAAINSTYAKFEKLDNSSNFMSKGTTTFNNINGQTVTVDSFIYPPNSTKDNMNVGQGLMIYQALLYKQAYPQEEVYIDIASYRFSVQAGVNINRNSRYFGYMRNLPSGVDYDEYGFVRIAYLLITAAKMGIHVNIVGQIDGYPASTLDKNLYQYFTTQLEDPCDPAYVKNSIISDYLNFSHCEWTVGSDGKGGTDMMHTKLCAVSHYLDMNGIAHKNAVWTSSANLDGIKNNGVNGNWTLQTATIISDHEGIYRTSVNYLRLMAGLCEQEDIIEFQDTVNSMSTEQIDLILAGKENLIPKDKQIVYLGSASDKVFEMYFTPFGGGRLSWDEKYNPYCKYLRELYDSEDFIMFSWNAAQYNGGFPLGIQMETMITDAFHKNKHVNNVVYMNTETFDGSSFDDLIVGKDIGFKSFNTKDFGSIHNKDLLFSYSKDGQRYYVSLLNSCNMHGGSMYYQSNFTLVIKETSCSDDSVYSIMAKHTTKGDMVHHEYGDLQSKPSTATEHGHTYKTCKLCGKEKQIDVLHYAGDWIIDRDATQTQNGIRHRNCTVCNKLLETSESLYQKHLNFKYKNFIGKTFTSNTNSLIPLELEAVPLTLEALIQVPTNRNSRAGVIVGNYKNSASKNSLNLEIHDQGKVRLFFTTNSARVDCVFSTDIRSDDPVHIAVTVDQVFANLYINGKLAETKLLNGLISNDNKDNFVVGGDNREGNTQYFRGTIYSVNLFSDVRTAEEINRDALLVTSDLDNLLYSEYYTSELEALKISPQTLGSIFSKTDIESIGNLSSIPQTIEATILLPTSYSARGGVITGNYGANTSNALNLEVLEKGKLRLYYLNNGQKVDHTFATDIRSDIPINIAVTVDGTLASLYINGTLTETAEVAYTLPTFSDKFCIGGDNREGNTQYFKGTIYSVNLFSNARNAEEISKDMICVTKDSEHLLHSSYFTNDGVTAMNGQSFSQNVSGAIDCTLNGIPQTFEATVLVPKDINTRAGVIVGNYTDLNATNEINLEIYYQGKVRLFFVNGDTKVNCIFPTDIRSDKPVNIAVTIDGDLATLYVDGKYSATEQLATTLPEITNTLIVGGDYRENNRHYFKGTIYSVNLFGDVRTPEEINQDALLVTENTDDLLFGGYYATQEAQIVGLDSIHKESRCIIDREATDSYNGVYHTECECCNKILTISEYSKDFTAVSKKDYSNASGLDTTNLYRIDTLSSTPKTFEVTMQLSPTHSARAGTLIGNYDGSTADQINIEIYTNGQPRLYCKSGTTAYTYLFKTDIRSESLTHLAFTVNKLTASLYVNGVLTETVALTEAVPSAYNNYCIGGDNRSGNAQAFQGNIYAVNLFSDVRTSNEILFDAITVTEDVDNLLFSKYFLAE